MENFEIFVRGELDAQDRLNRNFALAKDAIEAASQGGVEGAIEAHNEDDEAHENRFATKAARSTTTAVTLPISGWGSTEPYTQTVSIPGIVAGINWIYDIAGGATKEQRGQYLNAQLFDVTPQGQDAVTFLAMGDLPTVDIPLKILIVG